MIKNPTTKTILSKKVKFCRNTFSKFIGLMFSKRMKIEDFQRPEMLENRRFSAHRNRKAISRDSKNFRGKTKPLIFIFKEEKIIPLHMLFVFYSIDILFLDKNKKVVEIKENFRPFSFYTPKNKAKYVVELPKGVIKNSGTKIGDKISF